MESLLSSVGITSLLSPVIRFTGDLKSRYTDFVVREISESGSVIRLTRLWPHPLAELVLPPSISGGDDTDTPLPTLETALPAESAAAVRALLAAGSGEPIDVPLPSDKAARRALHAAVRATSDLLESETVAATSVVRVALIGKAGKKRGRDSNHGGGGQWRGGAASAIVPPFLHFTLHKVNLDTTTAIQALARAMGVRDRSFGYAGTKDKRAATTQRVSLFRAEPAHVAGAARSVRGVAVGDFSYSAQPLHLGELAGNQFVITIRDVATKIDGTGGGRSAVEDVETVLATAITSLSQWRESGGLFISYFGLQRFGGTASLGSLVGWGGTENPQTTTITTTTTTTATAEDSPLRTHRIGRLMLAGDWLGALRLVLAPRPGGDIDVAAASQAYLSGEITAAAAAARLRNSYPCLERTVLLALAKNSGGGGGGATTATAIASIPIPPPSNGAAAEALFSATPPSLRLMYVHAYQSYLWNSIASARVAQGRVMSPSSLSSTDTASSHFHAITPLIGDLVFDGDCTEGAAAEGGGEGDEMETAVGGGIDANSSTATATATQTTHTSTSNANVSVIGPPPLPRVRVLTAEDIASGRYTLRDIVLPVPGTMVEFPTASAWGSSAVAECIRADGLLALPDFLKGDDATATAAIRHLFAARDRRPAFVGAYRRLIGKARDLSWTTIRFSNDTEDLCVTDFERCVGRAPPLASLGNNDELVSTGVGPRAAIQVRLSLDKSHYATVALREVLA